MATKFYPILDQVDGIKDTFEIPDRFIPGRVNLAYNGQIYDTGQNITAESPLTDPATVTLSFVPTTDTHTLMIIYEEELPVTPASALGIRGFVHPPGGLLNDF